MNTSYQDPSHKMDHMYRHARHIYNATRKYYLLGRDTLLDHIAQHPADHVLEIGCGTARNLIGLASKLPHAHLFGLDASTEMLKTATKSVHRAGHTEHIVLRQGLAEHLDPAQTFGLTTSFDTIFFSYSLSMMPAWPRALDAALQILKPNGRLYIVDFWDQADLPKWFSKLLTQWLTRFNVTYHPELLDHLNSLAQHHEISLSITPFGHRYAFIVEARKHLKSEGHHTCIPQVSSR
ncbi:MAG: S-adenosylmethionine-diacylgycerolhomoserine-N-methyltransferase [Candidatus Latescibacterota bacterium]|jgi:S-adenosylmethionine-diacylgycerolhomoserine-N-methlytransferase